MTSASGLPQDLSRFTEADERLLERIAAKLQWVGFTAVRQSLSGVDCYELIPYGNEFAAWVILRQYDGAYQLQDGRLRVLREGSSLEEVLLPGWVP